MKCPRCALHHPPQHEVCVACGTRFDGAESAPPQAPKNKLSVFFGQKRSEDGPAEKKGTGGISARNFDRVSQTQSSIDQLVDELYSGALNFDTLEPMTMDSRRAGRGVSSSSDDSVTTGDFDQMRSQLEKGAIQSAKEKRSSLSSDGEHIEPKAREDELLRVGLKRQDEFIKQADLKHQQEAQRQEELKQQAEVKRQEELKQRELKQQQELERKQQAELERQDAELKRQEEAKRPAAELKLQEELKKHAELKRQEELRYQEELKQQVEMKRQQELKRQEDLRQEAELRRQEDLKWQQAKLARQEVLKRKQMFVPTDLPVEQASVPKSDQHPTQPAIANSAGVTNTDEKEKERREALVRENEASRAAEQKRLSELAEARLIADNEVAQKRAVELRRQAAERIEFEKQEKQRQLLAQRVQEQLRREVERRNEIEVTRRTTESQRNLELQMLPVGAAVYAASNDQDAYQEPRNQEPHRPHRSRDQDSESSADKPRGYDANELQNLQRSYRGGGGIDHSDKDFVDEEGDDAPADQDNRRQIHKTVRPSKATKKKKGGITFVLGSIFFIIVLLIFAGATIFFLTKPPDDQRLYQEGLEQVKKGEYAFAVKSLNDALALRPKDPKVYLALARAYVGVDQVDKAWACVSQAQQLGAGVAEEPDLASDLSKYYRQKGEYEKAINLLRPLAKAETEGKQNLRGKKAELADLDAMWGDDALRDGKLELALRCWEEVRDLNDGSRASEAQSRLATIYQKLANTLASDTDTKNDADALKYLNKLNNIAENPKNLEMAADLYERSDQLELAIDQLRKADKMGHNPVLQRKLSALLTRRGKELLDKGESDSGYAYLQQAKSVSPSTALPAVALKEVVVAFDQPTASPKITGRVWNPTDKSVNSLTVKVELFDTTTSRVLWSKDKKIVDEFVPPLGAQESKPFEFVSEVPAKMGSSEFRIYLDGNMYKSYPIGGKNHGGSDDSSSSTASSSKPMKQFIVPPRSTFERSSVPPVAPPRDKAAQSETPSPVAPTPQVQAPTPAVETPSKGPSAEERTMKDLDQ